MATVIRLQRGGRKKRPFYSIVVMDSRKRRDGAFIEKLGYYDPCKDPEVIELNLERVKSWTEQGAQISPRVSSLVAKIEKTSKADEAAVEKKPAKKKAAKASTKAAESEKKTAAKKEETVASAAAEDVPATEDKPAEAAAEEVAEAGEEKTDD